MFSSVSFLRSWRIDDHQRNCVGKRNESEAIAIHFCFNNNKKKQNKHIRHFLFFLSIIMLLFFLMYFIYLAALLNICVVWATAVATHTRKKQTRACQQTRKANNKKGWVGVGDANTRDYYTTSKSEQTRRRWRRSLPIAQKGRRAEAPADPAGSPHTSNTKRIFIFLFGGAFLIALFETVMDGLWFPVNVWPPSVLLLGTPPSDSHTQSKIDERKWGRFSISLFEAFPSFFFVFVFDPLHHILYPNIPLYKWIGGVLVLGHARFWPDDPWSNLFHFLVLFCFCFF